MDTATHALAGRLREVLAHSGSFLSLSETKSNLVDIHYRGHKMVMRNAYWLGVLPDLNVMRIELAHIPYFGGPFQIFMDVYQGDTMIAKTDTGIGISRKDLFDRPANPASWYEDVEQYILEYGALRAGVPR